MDLAVQLATCSLLSCESSQRALLILGKKRYVCLRLENSVNQPAAAQEPLDEGSPAEEAAAGLSSGRKNPPSGLMLSGSHNPLPPASYLPSYLFLKKILDSFLCLFWWKHFMYLLVPISPLSAK